MLPGEFRYVQAATLRAIARDAVRSANRLDPYGRQFIVLEFDMAATTDLKTVTQYMAAQQSRITTLEQANAALVSNQKTADDVEALNELAATASSITAAESVPAAAPVPA